LSNTPWATRWDNYLHVLDPSIHWFSLVNSIVIVLFLTGMVAMILIRALHKDISRYNAVDAQVRDRIVRWGNSIILIVYIGGCTRRLWLEISSWRCIPTSSTSYAFICFSW
jgi:hypothetical protein